MEALTIPREKLGDGLRVGGEYGRMGGQGYGGMEGWICKYDCL